MKKLFGVTEMFCSFIMEVVTWMHILVKIHLKWVYLIICKSYLNKIDLKSKNIHTHKTLLTNAGEKKVWETKYMKAQLKALKNSHFSLCFKGPTVMSGH